ncbi:hypothetical protein L1A08_07880 [Rubinisphaera sp. ICM_H10]|nr:hypothetical protein [Rubinisphaera margarita]
MNFAESPANGVLNFGSWSGSSLRSIELRVRHLAPAKPVKPASTLFERKSPANQQIRMR